MAHIAARKEYEHIWRHLDGLVRTRNGLLKRLASNANYAGDFVPSHKLYMDFDFELARRMLAQAQAMQPEISAAIDKLNALAERAGKPLISHKPPYNYK